MPDYSAAAKDSEDRVYIAGFQVYKVVTYGVQLVRYMFSHHCNIRCAFALSLFKGGQWSAALSALPPASSTRDIDAAIRSRSRVNFCGLSRPFRPQVTIWGAQGEPHELFYQHLPGLVARKKLRALAFGSARFVCNHNSTIFRGKCTQLDRIGDIQHDWRVMRQIQGS